MNDHIEQPSIYIPESKKDEDYHKSFARYLIHTSDFDGNFFGRCFYNVKYYQNRSDVRTDHNLVLNTAANIEYPNDMNQHNYFRTLVEASVGDILDRDIETHAVALSRQALDRKQAGLVRMQAKYQMREFDLDQQDMTGIPLISPNDPINDDQLQEKKRTYKEDLEVFYERALKEFWERNKMNLRLSLVSEDSRVCGVGHLMPRMIDNKVYIDYLPADQVVFGTSGNDPNLTDTQYYIIIRYMSLVDAQLLFNIPEEDMVKLEKDRSEFSFHGTDGAQYSYPVFVQKDDDHHQILITEAYWMDVNLKKLVDTPGKNGFTHAHIRDVYHEKDRKSKGETKSEFPVQICRKCVIIGADYCPPGGYGKVENQFRNHSNWTTTRWPIISIAPKYKKGMITSDADMLIPSDKFIDRCWWMMSKAKRKDRGKGMTTDLTQKPNNQTVLQQQYMFDVYGYFLENSRQIGGTGQYHGNRVIDLSLSQTASEYMNWIGFAKHSMREQIGVADPQVQTTEMTGVKAGVMEAHVRRTEMRKLKYYAAFDTFLERLCENVINLIRICIKNDPDGYVHIIGSDGIEFFKKHPDADLDDYGVVIKSMFANEEMRNRVQTLLEFGLNAQQVPFELALETLLNKDNPKEALFMLRDKMNKIRMEQQVQAKQQEAMQMAQQQEAQRIQQQIAEMQAQEMQAQRQHDLTIENLSGMRDMNKANKQAKITLSKARMDNQTDLAIEQIRRDAQLKRMNAPVSSK